MLQTLAAIGPILGGLGQVAGGAAGLFGGGGNNGSLAAQTQNALDDRNWQREVFYNQIRARTADAKLAGIHPLYALGAPSFSPSPTAIYGGDSGGGADVGSAFRNMGQGLERAIAAGQTKEERVATAFEIRRQQQQLEYGDLQNELLRQQINKTANPAQLGPGLPANVGDGRVEVKPNEIISADPRAAHKTAGQHPGTEYVRMPDGGMMPTPAKPLNIDEVSSPGWLTWMWQNKLLPFFDSNVGRPSDRDLPPGAYRWQYHMGTWHPIYHQDVINRSRGQGPFSHLPERSRDFPQPRVQERFGRGGYR